MKAKIHPQYYHDCVVTCACGNNFTTGSVQHEIKVEICSACHPFFTGKMKFVDTLGRVEKFQKRMTAAKDNQYLKKSQRKQLKVKEESKRPETLKEMLTGKP
ncbi:MAG: 50S ribosomal protein L31 [Candidatus Beckwithbacteria bacterium]|nr:50S ribosomal protein L31 [Candidatus Beckwithbacteria bacterium]